MPRRKNLSLHSDKKSKRGSFLMGERSMGSDPKITIKKQSSSSAIFSSKKTKTSSVSLLMNLKNLDQVKRQIQNVKNLSFILKEISY